MPELPEVETVKEKLKLNVLGKKIVGCNVNYANIIEFPSSDEFISKIIGQVIVDINRRGKWLVFKLTDYYLVSHLRMEGKYNYRDSDFSFDKHDHVIFKFADGSELHYRDTRKFGRMYLADNLDIKPLLSLGLEPWDNDLNSAYLLSMYKNKRLPIKTVLLDQSIITGIGNIYADEILFLSRISPTRKCCDISLDESGSIIANTRVVLEKAIELGGTTIHSYTSSEGEIGHFQNKLYVHGRKGLLCSECDSKIEKIVVGGRGTYYCPKCQKN